jgi:hypothetical protein
MIDDDDYVLDNKDSYRDNPLLKKVGVKVEWTKETIEEILTILNDDAVIAAINNFVYSNPAQVLSGFKGFHCYGFKPIRVNMGVNTELKSYEYINEFSLVCMPTDDIVNGAKVTNSLPA